MKAFIQKVPSLARHINIRGNLYFIFYNFDKFLLLCNFEGILTNKHFIHHDSFIKIEHTKRPDINFLIVLFTP